MCVVLYVDINECGDSNNCDENAQCTNTEGSYTCSCNLGYTGDGVNCTSKSYFANSLCTYLIPIIQPADINECELETYSCHSNANCTDTDGSFNCTCRELLKSCCSFMNLNSTTIYQLGILSSENAVAFLKHTACILIM